MKTKELDYHWWFEHYKVKSPCVVLTDIRDNLPHTYSNAYFSTDNMLPTYKKCHIGISTSLPKERQLLNLLHELEHAKHYKRKCECMELPDRYLAEMHALRGEVKQTLKINDKILAKILIARANEILLLSRPTGAHYRAMIFIKSTKLWKKLEKLAK